MVTGFLNLRLIEMSILITTYFFVALDKVTMAFEVLLITVNDFIEDTSNLNSYGFKIYSSKMPLSISNLLKFVSSRFASKSPLKQVSKFPIRSKSTLMFLQCP